MRGKHIQEEMRGSLGNRSVCVGCPLVAVVRSSTPEHGEIGHSGRERTLVGRIPVVRPRDLAVELVSTDVMNETVYNLTYPELKLLVRPASLKDRPRVFPAARGDIDLR